mmetsp:Transcript_8988/g.26438  ORF Transcript_8988/g.26438 Transcript_8988/m.26438 type:complete len:341 (+) Transcript_8988:76-1098(+)
MDRQYNQNADVQRGQGAALLDSVRKCSSAFGKTESLLVADFGCGPGGNSVAPLQAVAAGAASSAVASVHVLMVDSQADPDLWKQLDNKIEELSNSAEVIVTWTNIQHSFYVPLSEPFMGCVDLAWSAVAAHWLSELPTSCPDFIVGNQLDAGDVQSAWTARAKEDWAHWLRLRALELRSGGRLVVAMPGRDASGDFVARGAWNVFTDIKKSLVRDGLLSDENAARLATREYWRSEDEVFEPLRAPDSMLEVESFWIEHRPCPFVGAKMRGALDAQECADKLIGAFQGFLSTEFNAALGEVATMFWDTARGAAVDRAKDMDLHVIMHHLVLRRKRTATRHL